MTTILNIISILEGRKGNNSETKSQSYWSLSGQTKPQLCQPRQLCFWAGNQESFGSLHSGAIHPDHSTTVRLLTHATCLSPVSGGCRRHSHSIFPVPDSDCRPNRADTVQPSNPDSCIRFDPVQCLANPNFLLWLSNAFKLQWLTYTLKLQWLANTSQLQWLANTISLPRLTHSFTIPSVTYADTLSITHHPVTLQ